jgi:hypothetical protein
MKPNRELRKYYRKIITDFLYTDIENWKVFEYYTGIGFEYRINELYIIIYPYKFFNKIEIKINGGINFNMSSNININTLIYNRIDDLKNKEQKEFEQKCYDAIPLTSKRRLKIEQIYKK